MKYVHGRKYKIITPDLVMIIVDIYPVGIMAELEVHWRCRKFWNPFKTSIMLIRKRGWHQLKNHYNGYLAEPDIMPNNLTRCGSGWTRARAMKDLKRRLNKA